MKIEQFRKAISICIAYKFDTVSEALEYFKPVRDRNPNLWIIGDDHKNAMRVAQLIKVLNRSK